MVHLLFQISITISIDSAQNKASTFDNNITRETVPKGNMKNLAGKKLAKKTKKLPQ